jgi:hypothetical protein
MDPTYSDEAEAYREKMQAFLAEHLPADWQGIGAMDRADVPEFVAKWRNILADRKLLAASWPSEYGGGGLSELEQVVMAEEFQKAGVPTNGPNDVFGIVMVGNTLLHWGNEEQKAHFLPRIISGEYRFCQGYSEPGAGSDLAALGCRAHLDGDEWVINGQKIWTSEGHTANWIFVLCRTDSDAPKHRGISFILCPLDQAGVEVRPIKMMTGESEFNEMFFTDARTARENVVGEVNGGWAVAMTLLGYERGEAAATMPLEFRAEVDKLVKLAQDRGVACDPVIRDRLTRAHVDVEIMGLLGKRSLTGFLAGATPGPSESMFKLFWTEHHRRVTELAVDILGAEALAPDGIWPVGAFRTDLAGSANSSASWVGAFYNSRAGTIYAGTSEVQRNILGERVLGLPKEPQVG